MCIITSLNLYEFSQVNNNEMGIVVYRRDDIALYKDAYEEAQRIIRISDEVRISLEQISPKKELKDKAPDPKSETKRKLTTSKLAKQLNKSTDELILVLVKKGYLENIGEDTKLTEKGKSSGGERKSGRFGAYFLWNDDLILN